MKLISICQSYEQQHSGTDSDYSGSTVYVYECSDLIFSLESLFHRQVAGLM